MYVTTVLSANIKREFYSSKITSQMLISVLTNALTLSMPKSFHHQFLVFYVKKQAFV
jgi:hypothetical protein